MAGCGFLQALRTVTVLGRIDGVHLQDSFFCLLWDDGLVVFHNDAFDVMSPELLLLHRLSLDGVRLFGVFVMHDAETQGVFGVFVERQCGARDVRLVDIVLAATFGDEQHPVKEKERSFISGSMDLEISLQN